MTEYVPDALPSTGALGRTTRRAETVGDLLEPVRRRLLQTNGFVLDLGHVALSGSCQSCVMNLSSWNSDAGRIGRVVRPIAVASDLQ